MADFPRITIITPSFNQVAYLERTIRSVLDQNYPNLEYIIVDGGSTDGSVDIIQRYSDQLAWWVSEPDHGQTEAINKGLKRATGDWVAWQNSDDIYYPGCFHDLAVAAEKHPEAGLIIGNMMLIDEQDRFLRDICYVRPSYKSLLAEGMVLANQSAFWHRRIQEKIGLLDERFRCSFDYEWFLRVVQNAGCVHVNRVWGALRLHGETKTSQQGPLFEAENKKILKKQQLPLWEKKWYKLRRLALMIGQGQIFYVLRGLIRHAQGKGGELY